MTRPTISELTDQLADALGMHPKVVKYAADDLQHTGKIGQPDKPATVVDAVNLLIAATAPADVRAPSGVTKRFIRLA